MDFATAISLGVDALSPVIGFATKHHDRKQNLKDSKSLMKYQQELGIENWKMQNEYNLPSNQKERMMMAGYNPLMFSPNGDPVSMQSVGLGSSPDSSAGTANALTAIATMANLRNQAQLTKSQVDVNKSIEQKNSSDAYKSAEEGALLAKQNIDYIAKRDIDWSKSQAETTLALSAAAQNEANIGKISAQTNVAKKQAEFIDASMSDIYSQIKTREQLATAQVKKLHSAMAVDFANAAAAHAQAGYYVQQTALGKQLEEFNVNYNTAQLEKITEETNKLIAEGAKLVQDGVTAQKLAEYYQKRIDNLDMSDREKAAIQYNLNQDAQMGRMVTKALPFAGFYDAVKTIGTQSIKSSNPVYEFSLPSTSLDY